MNFYMVLAMHKTIEVGVFGVNHEMLLRFADGMTGAVPVFDSREKAVAFAKGRYTIQAIEMDAPIARDTKSKRTTVRSKACYPTVNTKQKRRRATDEC